MLLQLEGLEAETAANPHRPKGPRQKLYQDTKLEALAVSKWGSSEAFQAERQKRANAKSTASPGKAKPGVHKESHERCAVSPLSHTPVCRCQEEGCSSVSFCCTKDDRGHECGCCCACRFAGICTA